MGVFSNKGDGLEGAAHPINYLDFHRRGRPRARPIRATRGFMRGTFYPN